MSTSRRGNSQPLDYPAGGTRSADPRQVYSGPPGDAWYDNDTQPPSRPAKPSVKVSAALRERMDDIHRVMLDGRNFSRKSGTTQAKVVRKVGTPHGKLSRAFLVLKAAGLIDSTTGSFGGTWLTEAGQARSRDNATKSKGRKR